MKEGEKYHVLPIDDRVMERFNAETVGRPDIMEGGTSITLAEGMTGMTENTFLSLIINPLQLLLRLMFRKMEAMELSLHRLAVSEVGHCMCTMGFLLTIIISLGFSGLP